MPTRFSRRSGVCGELYGRNPNRVSDPHVPQFPGVHEPVHDRSAHSERLRRLPHAHEPVADRLDPRPTASPFGRAVDHVDHGWTKRGAIR